jgi:hypothetical protein
MRTENLPRSLSKPKPTGTAGSILPRNGSLARDLPIVVTRAVARTRGRQQVELDDMR